MAVEIIMPKMGESIVEGTIVEWKKSIPKDLKEHLTEVKEKKGDK